jgi:hypothetical protein
VGFKPTISLGEWPRTYDLDRAATGTGHWEVLRERMCLAFLSQYMKIVDVRGSMHLGIIHTKIINKMQQFIRIYYSTFIWRSTCFERHTAHHQELKNCTSSPWFYIRLRLLDVELDADRIYYSMFIWSSTCFERHTAHHQELKNCTSSPWFYIRVRLLDVELDADSVQCSSWALDDERCVARNMLSFI